MKRLLFIVFLFLLPVTVFAWDDDYREQDNFRRDPQSVYRTPDGGDFDPQTGTHYYRTDDGTFNPRKGEFWYDAGKDQYFNPRTGQFIQRR